MSTAAEKNELKVQGAVEAAQDPESTISADDAQKKILEESKKAGVTAFTFDPDASPEEKRRQAREFNESFKWTCTPDTQFKIEVKGDRTFRSADDLGDVPYVVDDSGSGAERVLKAGGGTVTVKSTFTPTPQEPDSPRSTMRRSFLSKRESRSREDAAAEAAAAAAAAAFKRAASCICKEKGQEWFHLAGASTGRVKMMAQWKPVAISGVLSGTGGYVTPIGVMRFYFRGARDLRNFETLGKSDPYVRVLLSGIEKARTVTHRNTLDPDWDEVLYVPVHSNREKLTMEVMDSEKMGKDRSLGQIEVAAGDYIFQDEHGEYLVHDQKTMKEAGLKLHGKGIAKGLLIHNVSFYPTLNVADPEEEEEEAKETKPEAEAGEPEPLARSATASKFSSTLDNKSQKASEGDDSSALVPLTPTSTRKSKESEGPPKIHLSPEQLLKYETGLLIFKLMEAEMPESNTHLEVWVDDMAFPSYISSAAKHKKHKFDEIGDCFIREIDFSRLTLKVREKGQAVEGNEKDKESTIAKLQGNTLDTLKQCLNNPTMLKLNDKDGRSSNVKVSLKYIPVKMKLDPSESINNMGTLRVDVLDAEDLPSADRNGKSDPYCKFELNGEEVYKTKVQKKTLHPVWNEFFEVPVPSRTGADFKVVIWDYDFADKPDLLGSADINLEHIDPFKPSETKLLLDGKSGVVRLRLLFRPAYVARTRQGTSTFSGTFAVPGRIVTGVAGAPVKAAGAVGSGVGGLVRNVFSRSKKDDEDRNTATAYDTPTITENGNDLKRSGPVPDGNESPISTPPGTANGATLGHSRNRSSGAASIYSTNGASPGSACSTYYRTSLRRVRRNFRDDINREMQLKKLDNDHESLEWINSFLLKFWPIYQPVLAQTIINSVDQVLSSATPAFLDSLKLKTFTLGSKPPRMEHVKTYPKAEDDIVMMDWKFSFTPNDTADMTSKQIKSKINPKVVLEIRVGKAMISKGLDVIVEDMAFSGIMRLKIKLQIPFPHVEKVEMCFLERPTIDYVCKPLGGETFGFDINFIPGLETFILEQIHGNLAPMMYAPNVFPIEVAKMLAGTPVDQAIGVLAVTLHGAQGLKNSDRFAGDIDPYAVLSLNRRQELARTKHISDTSNPRWNETHYIIITSFTDSLDIQVFDYNDFRKHKELGVASFPLDQVEELNVHENERLDIFADGKNRGQVSIDVRFFPVLESTKLEDGSEEPPPESNTGILRFTVEQAKDLDGTKSLVGLLNPYATLHLNGRDVHNTKKLKRTNNPIWDNGLESAAGTASRFP
ncbi:hypothetical protein BN1723_013335 [Verticillium longisporum]|uniref:C2 domain-containing protein n=1 Tax=Verticillium longisporum TaxID=100787 RepID=A0A0G4LR36_VERLO|nr:hypothetical protein BN1723_013335 [Verticillium longisporum]